MLATTNSWWTDSDGPSRSTIVQERQKLVSSPQLVPHRKGRFARIATFPSRGAKLTIRNPLPPPVHVAVQEYRQALEHMLPGRVRRITVFGSVARGEANEDSDLDILVLLDAPSFHEKAPAIDHATEIGLRHDLVFAPMMLAVDQWQKLEQRERSFPREVTRDGIDA
jgi:hypothetical protein